MRLQYFIVKYQLVSIFILKIVSCHQLLFCRMDCQQRTRDLMTQSPSCPLAGPAETPLHGVLDWYDL